jgi:hypothetical protein
LYRCGAASATARGRASAYQNSIGEEVTMSATDAFRFDLLVRLCVHMHIHVRLEARASEPRHAPVVDQTAVNELVVLLARAAYERWKRGELLPISAEA